MESQYTMHVRLPRLVPHQQADQGIKLVAHPSIVPAHWEQEDRGVNGGIGLISG